MSLETKGQIKFDPDVKLSEPQYMIEAKQLGICTEGSGNLEQMVDELTERIRRGISEEFGIPRCDVQDVRLPAHSPPGAGVDRRGIWSASYA